MLEVSWGVQPQFIVNIVFEIAVDQQTKTNDQILEGVPDPNRPDPNRPDPNRPCLVYFWPMPIMQNPDLRCCTCN